MTDKIVENSISGLQPQFPVPEQEVGGGDIVFNSRALLLLSSTLKGSKFFIKFIHSFPFKFTT